MNEYAFPRLLPKIELPPGQAAKCIEDHAGMTLRDYFAASALQGLLSCPLNPGKMDMEEFVRLMATRSYQYADAMLAERAKK